MTLWSDYLCPWCYLSLDRHALLTDLGVEVTVRPFELHPEIGPEGRLHRSDGRTIAIFESVGAECEAAGLRFRMPARTPNTNRVLQVGEFVRTAMPDAFPVLHRSLFEAHFADGLDIGDPEVVETLVARSGADVDAVRDALDTNETALALNAARDLAREDGVAGTPTLVFDNGLVLPGVPPRATLERWVTRMSERATTPQRHDAGPGERAQVR